MDYEQTVSKAAASLETESNTFRKNHTLFRMYILNEIVERSYG